MRKKLIIISIVVIIVLLLSAILYFRPIKITVPFLDKYNTNIFLTNNFGRCNVKSIIVYPEDIKIVINDIKKSGYQKQNNNYIKKQIVNNSCKKILEEHKKKIIYKLKGNDKIVEALSEYTDEGYNFSGKNSMVQQISNINTKKLGKQVVIYKLDNGIYIKYLVRNVEVKDTQKPVIELKVEII